MDKKILIASIVIIAVTCAGAVAAVTWNDTDMKTASFDGIKMKVPADAKFTQTVDGFKNTEYGITVKTFDSNESMVNYLKNINTGKMTTVANQPPNSVAFTQDDATYILVTNGEEGICVGAIDQDLVVEMANSVVFNNGKHSELDKGFFGVGAKHMDPDVDFNLILAIIGKVDNRVFNHDSFVSILPTIVQDSEIQQTTNIFGNDTISDGSDADSGSSDVGSVGSDTGSSDSGGSDTGSSDSGSSSSTTDDSNLLSETECKKLVLEEIDNDDKISSVDHSGDTYTFNIENSDGDSCGSITIDAKTGEITSNNYEHVDSV